jgi:hypothetical protein
VALRIGQFIWIIGLSVVALGGEPRPKPSTQITLDVQGFNPEATREPRGIFWTGDDSFTVFVTQHNAPRLTGRKDEGPATTNLVFQEYSAAGKLYATHTIAMHGHTEVAVTPGREVIVLTGDAVTAYTPQLKARGSFKLPRDDNGYSEWSLRLSPSGKTIWLSKTGSRDRLLGFTSSDFRNVVALEFESLGSWTASDDSVVRLSGAGFVKVDPSSGRVSQLMPNFECPGTPRFIANEILMFETCQGVTFANLQARQVSSFKVATDWRFAGAISTNPSALVFMKYTKDIFDVGPRIKALRVMVFSRDTKTLVHDISLETNKRFPVVALSPQENRIAILTGDSVSLFDEVPDKGKN